MCVCVCVCVLTFEKNSKIKFDLFHLKKNDFLKNLKVWFVKNYRVFVIYIQIFIAFITKQSDS